MTGINGVHLLIAYIREHAKTMGLRPDTDVAQILKESGALSARVQKIEQMLSSPKPVQAEDQPRLEVADWPVASLLRDTINRQPRQQIVGDWNISTTAVHEGEAFHHRTETTADPQPQQILLQRYEPTAGDLGEAYESYSLSTAETGRTFAYNPEREAKPEWEGSERGRFLLLAIGMMLILAMFL
jgi:hypothetical protein